MAFRRKHTILVRYFSRCDVFSQFLLILFLVGKPFFSEHHVGMGQNDWTPTSRPLSIIVIYNYHLIVIIINHKWLSLNHQISIIIGDNNSFWWFISSRCCWFIPHGIFMGVPGPTSSTDASWQDRLRRVLDLMIKKMLSHGPAVPQKPQNWISVHVMENPIKRTDLGVALFQQTTINWSIKWTFSQWEIPMI